MAERTKALVLKTSGCNSPVGSNPTLSSKGHKIQSKVHGSVCKRLKHGGCNTVEMSNWLAQETVNLPLHGRVGSSPTSTTMKYDFSKAKTTRQQGDFGQAAAVLWYVKEGYVVSVPTTEGCRYDLIVDKGTALHRVQVKTASQPRGNGFSVQLCTKGGNQSWNRANTYLSAMDCHEVVPGQEVYGKSSITVGNAKC